MSEVPEGFDVDTDPYTDEDGVGDDVDQPLPAVAPIGRQR